LGGFSLVQSEYVEMGRMIREMGVSVVFLQEGGYKLDECAALVRNIVLPDRK
jgi:acetoin utilization deacetylase AcuC-like enzyme